MRRKFLILITVVFLFVLKGMSQQQNVSYQASFSKDTIFIGDTLNLLLEASFSNNSILVFPEFKDTITKGLEIYQFSSTDTLTNKKGEKKARKIISLISFEPGVYAISGFPALYVQKDGLADTIYSNQVRLAVLPMPIDTNAIDTVFAGMDGKIIMGLNFAESVKQNFIPDSVKQSMNQQETDALVDQIYGSKRSEILLELVRQLNLPDTIGYIELLEEIIMAPGNVLFIINNSGKAERHVLPQLIKESFIQQKKEVKKGDPLFSYFPIMDIKPPYDEEWSIWEDFKIFLEDYGIYLIIIVLLIAIALIYFIYFKKKKQKEDLPAMPLEPAHIIAFRDLNDLKEKKLWQAGKVKEFHSRLTEILRRYMEQRYGIMALEQTTYEILQSIAKEKILNKQEKAILKEILELADLVKFAKFTPIPDENDRSLRNSYQFVEKTKIVEEITKNEDVDEKQLDETENLKDDGRITKMEEDL
ncbi:MAG: hypothetical protein JXR58_06865 [Bacteroidales bacterium]|nr:hypothetical protein [Bacteroidales bacterium]